MATKQIDLINDPIPTNQLKKVVFTPERAKTLFKKYDKTMRDLAKCENQKNSQDQ